VNTVAVQSRGQNREALRSPLNIDLPILIVTLCLVGLSLVMVYSTTAIMSQEKYGDSLLFVRKQGFAAVFGLLLVWLCSYVPLSLLRRVSPYLLIVCLVLLVLPLLPGIGDSAGGARRWVYLGSFRFQPVELIKLCFTIFIAGYFARHEKETSTFVGGLLKPMALAALLGALLLAQPDFGSASVIMLVTLAIATASGARIFYLTLGGAALAVCMAILVYISPYRMGRVVGFLSPFADASGKGYQLIQSLIAVGSGQVLGVGLGGSQQKLFYLPAAHTDFIFAVIAEELGFVGCAVVITLFLVFFWRGLRLARRFQHESFAFGLAIGLTALIVIPAFLNMGVVLGLLPTKGLVLPLVGYGGSSLIASLAAVGFLLGLARSWHRQDR
jgi:cell division protein FtsW